MPANITNCLPPEIAGEKSPYASHGPPYRGSLNLLVSFRNERIFIRCNIASNCFFFKWNLFLPPGILKADLLMSTLLRILDYLARERNCIIKLIRCDVAWNSNLISESGWWLTWPGPSCLILNELSLISEWSERVMSDPMYVIGGPEKGYGTFFSEHGSWL